MSGGAIEPVSNLSDYERALLRIKCWEVIGREGWGTNIGESKVEHGITIPPERKYWNWEERKVRADELFKWAMRGAPGDEVARPVKTPDPT